MRRALGIVGLALGVFGAAGTAAAGPCDLTTAGSTCTDVAGAIYAIDFTQPTGSGVINPFLRIQNDGTQSGYNTNADYDPGRGGHQFQFDQKNPHGAPDVATRNLQLFEVPIVNLNGTDYRQFLLDINEPASVNKELLSLDEVQLFLSPTGSLGTMADGGYNAATDKLAGLTAVYDMDFAGPGADYVKLDYSLNGSGSGKNDMVLYIPNSIFINNGATANTFVYLYSHFGENTTSTGHGICSDSCDSGDGFEEWWVFSKTGGSGGSGEGAVPEPGSMLLVGSGLVLLGRNLKKHWR